MRTRPAVWAAIAAASALLATATAVAGDGSGLKGLDGGDRVADRPLRSSPSDLVLVTTDGGLRTLATDLEGRSFRGIPGGIVIPGTTRVISTARTRTSTRLGVTDLISGEMTRLSRFAGELIATVASGSGRYVALTPPRREGATPWLPDGRRETRIVVAPVRRTDLALMFSLKGNFEPEAFSTDDRTLFLIEYMPALAPSHYAVRRLNLATGRVAPIARLKLAAPRVMRGTGRMQVLAPDRTELYTLYTQQGPNYAHGAPQSHDTGEVHAFVHVLNLRDRWAHCIDLPAPFGEGRATASALAATPDGGRLYVTDWTNGVVATLDPSKLSILDIDEVSLGGADDQTFAAASDEIIYVAGQSTVVAFDATTMSEIARWRASAEIEGLAVGSTEDVLYVAHGDRVVILDPRLRTSIRTWRVSGTTGILGAFETEEGVGS